MKRSKFSLSNYKLFSCDMGELVPCGVFEVLPGDTIQMATSALIRAAPLLAPVMHPLHVRIHHFYVPYRLIWTDFEKFITGGPDGMDATVYPTITHAAGGWVVGSLADYLGWPTGVNNIIGSALPHRAYQMIWNEYYRDQDLQTAAVLVKTNGNDVSTAHTLQNCDWEKDYFTASRPWEQKGPAITIPLGAMAPVVTTDAIPRMSYVGADAQDFELGAASGQPQIRSEVGVGNPTADRNVKFGTVTGLQANLASASAITINLLREAMALQRFEEARARFGSRYTEYLRYLGVKSSDARLQRPEYLGGGRQTIQFSEVLQTAEGTNPVGTMRGHGIGAMRSNRFRRFIEEHGLVISLLSVRPKTIYFQGLPRMFNRRAKDDFWQKELEHIGSQEVLNKEIYAAGASPDAVFGYQDRYDEYRRTESTVAGEFKSSTLNHWHMAREFGAAPALNSTFVSCVPTERTFAVPSQDVLYIMANHSIQARRLVAATGSSFTM